MSKRFQFGHKPLKKSWDSSEIDQGRKQEDWFCAIRRYSSYDLNSPFYMVDKTIVE